LREGKEGNRVRNLYAGWGWGREKREGLATGWQPIRGDR